MTEGNQPEAVRYPFGIIEVQKRDRGAPTGGNAFDATAVETKMASPSLLSRVEEEDSIHIAPARALAPGAGDVREWRASWPSPQDACCLNCW